MPNELILLVGDEPSTIQLARMHLGLGLRRKLGGRMVVELTFTVRLERGQPF